MPDNLYFSVHFNLCFLEDKFYFLRTIHTFKGQVRKFEDKLEISRTSKKIWGQVRNFGDKLEILGTS